MARILLIGTATLDLVFRLDHYPDADEEMRAQSLRTGRGGNAANSAVVLAGLGHEAEFLGMLADAPETAVIERDLAAHGVDYRHCPRMAGRPPTSSIYLCGPMRSIVHYRDLPELDAAHFLALDLGAYDWLHFEGRNVGQLARMLAHARSSFPDLSISLELEKHRAGIETLFGQADLLLCSRGFASHCGFDKPQDFLHWMQTQSSQAAVAAAWGKAGAYGLVPEGRVCHAPATLSVQAIDTLGAGDTFNAAVIAASTSGLSLQEALLHGCQLAGQKCGVEGFDLWRT